MKKLITFHGDKNLKRKMIAEVKRHQVHDQIIKGSYEKSVGDRFRGCKVGCSIHSLNLIQHTTYSTDSHAAYETGFGISRVIARLSDRILEGLPADDSMKFPLEFWKAVPVGVDVSKVWKQFLVWMLIDETDGVIKYSKSEEQKQSILNVANLITKSLTKKVSAQEFKNVRWAAYIFKQKYTYAAYAAAAATATYAAAAAYAAADDAATYAADAADAAADADADAAADADADADAAAARKNMYQKMKNKLLQLLKQAKK